MIKALFSATALLSIIPTFQLSAQDYRAQAIRILSTVPLIDGHNDIPDAIRERGGLDSVNFAVRQPKLMTDIPRLRALRMFHKLGTRSIPLTHWRSLDWATASTDTARRGLSPFGKQVVLEMNRLGMLVDLSHVNDQTMSDALHTSRAPVIFSHSSARALTNHARDVPDSILKLVAANRGVVMVNFNPGFVSESVRVYGDGVNARLDGLRAAGADSATRADSLKAWNARAPHATLQQVADHIEHIRQVAGVDCVGLGSDFDGITEVPVGLEDVSKFPDVIAELLRRGWTEADVKKVAGLNTLRVMREAERVAVEMRSPPRR